MKVIEGEIRRTLLCYTSNRVEIFVYILSLVFFAFFLQGQKLLHDLEENCLVVVFLSSVTYLLS